MTPLLRRLLPFGLVAAFVLAAAARALPDAPADAGSPVDDPAVRAATFAFAPGAAPADRKLFLDAVAHARPEARELIGVVDGLVDVGFVDTGDHALGVTSSSDGKRYSVEIDLAKTYAGSGMRGIDRVVLHELGHVIDFAIVPDDLRRSLDAQIPAGYECRPGEPTGSCAPREERFAETFAKWATGDIGAALWVGYMVPPPSVTLDAWGIPLARLAGT